MASTRLRQVDRHFRGPLPRPPFGGRLFYPTLVIFFGNGIIAAAIYGDALHVKNRGTTWLGAIAAQVAAIVIVSALPKRIFLVRARRLTLNFALVVPPVGAYITAPIFGVTPAIGFVVAGVAAVMFWTVHPSSVRHLVRRLEREGLLPRK